jgi:CRP-like cAMP-binding protein
MDEESEFPGRDLTNGLSDKERQIFEKHCRRQQYKRHSIIFNQGDRSTGVLYIERGWVKTFYTSNSGKEMMVGLWTRGNIVGTADIDYSTRLVSCQAVSDCVVRGFDSEDIDYFIKEIPSFVRNLVTALSFKVRWATAFFESLATEPVPSRVAHCLVTLAMLHGVKSQNGHIQLQGVSHMEIAQMVGTTRQSVTLALAKFQKDKLVQCSNRSILVMDFDALACV